MSFTRAALRKLTPGQSKSEGGVTYTRLQNDGRWSVNVMVNRTRHHQVVGLESEGYTYTQAAELVASLKAAKREAEHGVSAPKHRARFTVAKAADDYLDYLRDHNGKDLAGKEARFRLHLVRLLGSIQVGKLTEDEWGRYVTTRRAEGATDATINRERSALLHMLRTAVRRKKLRAMPCELQRQKEAPGRLVYLRPAQLRQLIEAAGNDPSPHALPFVMISGFTGMRQEPILALRVGDLDLDNRVIWVGKDKAGRREQPMPAVLAEYLRELVRGKAADAWVFATSKSKRGRAYQINGVFARCVQRAGLPASVTPHTMRHTVATNAAHAGLDAATIQALGGWKTRAMAERYTHAANLASAMDTLQGHLEGRVTPKLHRGARKRA